MQMYIYIYMFVIVVLQNSKYPYPAHQPLPDTPLGGSRHLQFLFFKFTTALWSGKENVILTTDNAPLWPEPVKDNCIVGQSKSDSHYDSQIDPYISMHIDRICLQQNATQMLRNNTVSSPWGNLPCINV